MRVLDIARNFPNTANPNDGTSVREMVRAFRDAGIDQRVAHLDERIIWPFKQLHYYRIENEVPVETYPWVIHHRVQAWPRAFLIAQRAKRWGRRLLAHVAEAWPNWRPDLIHARTFIPSAAAAQYLKQEFACPLIISTHGADTRDFVHRWTTRSAVLKLSLSADRIICVSESIYEILLSKGVSSERMKVIYNGMDMQKVQQHENILKTRYAGKRIIVGVGNLVPCKGYDILIQAIARLLPNNPNIHLIIVGGGNERMRLDKLIKQYRIEQAAELVGPRPPKEAMSYIDACEILCLPSWSEGFGIVYLEAMASGKPYIAVQGQGITHITQKYQTGLLVPPRDSASTAVAIKTLLDDSKMRLEMGRRGKELVSKHFTWDACVEQYKTEYEDLVKNARIP